MLVGCLFAVCLLVAAPSRAQGTLVSGGRHASTIAVAGEVDVWTITLQAGDVLLVDLAEIPAAAGSNSYFPRLRISDPRGSLLGSFSDDNAVELMIRAEETGAFVVDVDDESNTSGMPYVLHPVVVGAASPVVPAGDEGGPLVNGRAHAGRIGAPGDATAISSWLGDMDAWTFDAHAGSTVLLSLGEVDGPINGFQPWLRVFGPDGTPVAFGLSIRFAAAQSGRHTVVVGGFNVFAPPGGLTVYYHTVGDYRLHVAAMGLPFPPPTAGDDGGALGVGTTAGRLGTTQPGEHRGDLDVWTFDATAGQALLLAADTPFQLFDPSGVLVFESVLITSTSVSTLLSFVGNATATGAYAVVVGWYEDGPSGEYAIDRAAVPGPLPPVPVGADGGPLTFGVRHTGTSTSGTFDLWTFDATQDDAIVLGGAHTVIGPSGATVSAPADCSQSLNRTTTCTASVVTFTAPATGRYVIVVPGQSEVTSHPYSLEVVRIPGGVAPLATGDEGGPLVNGGNHAGRIGAPGQDPASWRGDIDVWTYDVPSAATLIVSAGAGTSIGTTPVDSNTFRPVVRIFGPTGALLATGVAPSSTDRPVASASTVASAGRYTVVVTGGPVRYVNPSNFWTTEYGEGHGIGDYVLHFVSAQGTPVAVPSGDEGGALSNGRYVRGRVGAEGATPSLRRGDIDAWTFDGSQGDLVVLGFGASITAPSTPLDFRVYTPTGQQVGALLGRTTGLLRWTLTASGTYCVVVSTAALLETEGFGDYAMDFARVPGSQTQIAADDDGGPLTPGAWQEGRIGAPGATPPSRRGDVDAWTFTASQGLRLDVSVEKNVVAPASSFAPRADLVGPTGTVLTTFNPVAPATGTYTLVVYDGSSLSGATGDYRVKVDFSVPVSNGPDTDGLPNTWEQQFGLNHESPFGDDGDEGDPDNDGRTNRQELTDGTHPRGFFQRYLAEGATGAFFSTRLAILNPGVDAAHAQLRYLKADGSVTSQVVLLAPGRRHTIHVAGIAGLASAEFSTLLESDVPVVLDRTMTWNAAGYGSHAETAVASPALTWYLAEGSTAGPFSLFYLIQNPDSSRSAAVTVTFLKPDGSTVDKDFTVQPKSRFNVWVNQIAEVSSVEVSAVITSTNDVPIIVERAMYLNTPTQVFAAGHESIGITTPATDWFFAEGATGRFFDEFVLIANPHQAPLRVRATYLLPGGGTLAKDYDIAPTSRFNIWVDEETFPGLGKALADTAVSVTLTSLDGQPFIAERAMWWPGPTSATWAEAHNSAGATATGVAWALAEGEVGGPYSTDTYILLANTSAWTGTAKVTLYFEDGTSSERAFTVPATSRSNVWVRAEFPNAVGRRFGAVIESLGETPAQLVVERAMYSNASGVTWAAGTNALATRLR